MNIKTVGGYTVKDFVKLEVPIKEDDRIFIYQGNLIGAWITDLKTKWDEQGCCTNLTRTDCFIDEDVLAVVPKT